MANKHYSDERRAAILDRLRFNKGNLFVTSQEEGVARATLRNWASGKMPGYANTEVIEQRLAGGKSAQIADQLEEMTPEMLNAARRLIPETKFKDLLEGASIAINNTQLLRGRPTSRLESLKISLVIPGGLRSAAGQVLEGDYTVTPELVAGTDKEE